MLHQATKMPAYCLTSLHTDTAENISNFSKCLIHNATYFSDKLSTNYTADCTIIYNKFNPTFTRYLLLPDKFHKLKEVSRTDHFLH